MNEIESKIDELPIQATNEFETWRICVVNQHDVAIKDLCTIAELKSYREANAVLLEAVRHYADINHWNNDDLTLYAEDFIANEYDFERSGFVVAQAALDKHAAMQGEG